MASLHERKSGRYFIAVYVLGKQYTISLGTAEKRAAERFLDHVDELENAAEANRPVARLTAVWSEELRNNPRTVRQYGSLAKVGFVVSREAIQREQQAAVDAERAAQDAEAAKNQTVGALIDEFIATLTHVKPQTRRNHRNSGASVIEYFGQDRLITHITPANASTWKKWMLGNYARATVCKRVKHTKAFFRYAVDAGQLERNPFEKVKAGDDTNPERKQYVSHDVVRKVIDAALDAEWKLIIGLAYYAGLRCPSEVFALKWDDIGREPGKFIVATPKTEGHGRGWKKLPIFPELKVLLDAVPRGSSPYVISKHRLPGGNLSAQVKRFIERAGVTPWMKTFNNLRASRRTDLARSGKFTDHSLSEWFGHDLKTANRHYVMTIDDDYTTAARMWTAQGSAQGSGAKTSAIEDKPSVDPNADPTRVLREILEKHGLFDAAAKLDLKTTAGIEPAYRALQARA